MDTLISEWLILRFFSKVRTCASSPFYPSPLSPGRGDTLIICCKLYFSDIVTCISLILKHAFLLPIPTFSRTRGDDHHLCDGRSCVLKSSPTPHCLHIPIHVLHSRSFAWQELYICLHARRYTPPPHLKFFWKWPRWMFWSSHRSTVSEQTHLVSLGLLGSCLVSRNPPIQRAEQPLQASAVE